MYCLFYALVQVCEFVTGLEEQKMFDVWDSVCVCVVCVCVLCVFHESAAVLIL